MSKKTGGIHFVKTTIIGGLLFLVPVGVLVIVLAKVVDLMLLVAEPMAADRVQRLNLPITAYMENVERFGQGTNELLTAANGSPKK